MSLNFYKSYINSIAKDPVSDWREATQAMINETWEDTSTIETVQGQSHIGSKSFVEESVQWNSVLDPKTGSALGDDFRKIIYKTLFDNELPPEVLEATQELIRCTNGVELYRFTTINGKQYLVRNSHRFLGKYYKFNNYFWLTINTNTVVGSNASAVLQRCNNILKWIDANGVAHEWPCVFERKLSSTQFDLGSEGVAEIDATTLIKVQRNSETENIQYNQRFIFDGKAFQVSQINNHISDTYLEIYMFETQVQSNDDLINNMANIKQENMLTINGTRLIPEINSISQDQTEYFIVHRYENGIITSSQYDISIMGPADNVNYKLDIIDGNNFSITNIMRSDIPMTLICTNKENPTDVVAMNILLTGEW